MRRLVRLWIGLLLFLGISWHLYQEDGYSIHPPQPLLWLMSHR